MSQGDREHGAYVHKVRADTQRYIQTLLDENARLRRITVTLESDKERLQEEKLRLTEQVLSLREELESFREKQIRLQQKLAESEAENQRFSNQWVEVEQRNNDLANLYVASYRLHGTLDRGQILTAIQEIIINLIGCEEIAIFETEPDGSALALVSTFGIEDESLRRIPVGEGILGRCARTGAMWVAGQDEAGERAPNEKDLTAVIPLELDGKVTGAIAVFRLLPQKGGRLEDLDRELFDLLATQAATSLYCITLRDKLAEVGA